jgi:hypothetical protein
LGTEFFWRRLVRELAELLKRENGMGRALRPGEEVDWKKLGERKRKPSRKAKRPSPQTKRDDDPQYLLQDEKPEVQKSGAQKKP